MRWDARLYESTMGPQKTVGYTLADEAGIGPADEVLDIGCGTGEITLHIAGRAGRVIGIDPSAEMIGRAGLKEAPNLSFVRTAVQEMGFDQEFDVIYSNSALQWVKQPREAARRMHMALRPGGRIALQFPASEFCPTFLRYTGEAIRELGYEGRFEGFEPPWYFPDTEEYRTVLSDAGFSALDVARRDYVYWFPNTGSVIAWWESAGLRPYLARLTEWEAEYFKYAVAMRYEDNRTVRGIEFGFSRLFAFGRKGAAPPGKYSR